jgi:hypothetical protein
MLRPVVMIYFNVMSQDLFDKTEEKLEEVGNVWSYSQTWNLTSVKQLHVNNFIVTFSLYR